VDLVLFGIAPAFLDYVRQWLTPAFMPENNNNGDNDWASALLSKLKY
jgi:hypothetical protein